MKYWTLLLMLALFVGVVTALPSSAQPKKLTQAEKDKFNGFVKTAGQKFQIGLFDAARTDYTEAYKIDPDPVLLLAIGQCYRNTKKPEEAIFSYSQYLQAVPDAADRVSIEETIKEIQDTLDQGTIEFTSEQNPAEFFLDGRSQGKTKATEPIIVKQLKPGEHSIEVRLENYKTLSKKIQLAKGQLLFLGVSLEPLPGIIKIDSKHGEVAVFVDEVLYSSIPPEGISVQPGEHQIRFTKLGFQNLEYPFTISANETKIFEPKLEPGKGTVQVNINIMEAKVSLDGEFKGKTGKDGTYTLTGIDAGPHKLLIQIFPLQKVTQSFVLEANDTQQIKYDFSSPVTSKVLFAIAAACAVSGTITAIGVAANATDKNVDGVINQAEFVATQGSGLAAYLAVTSAISAGTGAALGLKQRATNLIKKQNKKKQKENPSNKLSEEKAN